ncbi:MAG TPA: type VI secretion system tip protein TssI/VgrG [Polyangiaceae bacterium]|jgi:type VI secretion system secreted protein VgrG|nr:type VI secretion system tip protein TssI/VgrG [Polyangiaceae bacterium]
MADHFEITSSALPTQAKVAAFRGTEGISRPYVFDIYVTVDGVGEDVDVDDAPGAKVTLTIHDPAGDPIEISGMIASMELLRSIAINGAFGRIHSLYRLQLVPQLWQLSLTKHSRLWSGKSVPDVIKEVLDDEGITHVEFRLEGVYDVEEHVCQYKESSLNFIHRWMERLGMYYFFEQNDGSETLVITDRNATSVPSVAKPIPYHPASGGEGYAGPHLEMFTWRHATTPMAVRYTDYDYAKPALEMVGNAAVSPFGAGEQVTYGGRFFTRQQGEALASVRAEDLRARAKNFHGSGRVYGLASGYRFSVDRHPRAQLNTEYLAVSVEHFGAVADTMKTWGKALQPHDHVDETYFVEVTAIDATQQYRHPELAAWPRLDGFENAVVDGPSNSEYAQIDDHGRYKVKFKFDEGTLKSGQASTWVRKMQPHAGTVEGWHFPERAGTEVICAFLGGDPDRPIIIGAVPTVTTRSPVTSSNHTQNVIQTGGKNRFEMEDLAGQQRVTISTPHASTFLSMGNPVSGLGMVFNGDRAVPGHEAALATDKNIIVSSGLTTDLSVGADWNVWVDANHTEIIVGNVSQTVTAGSLTQTISTGSLTQDVKAFVKETYHNTLTQEVTDAVNLTHHNSYTHTVTAGLTHEVFQAGQTTEISGGDHNVTVTGNQVLHVTGSQTITIDSPVIEKWQANKDSFTYGVSTSMNFGFKKEVAASGLLSISAAAKAAITIGLNAEVNASLKLSATGSMSYELMPAKFQVAGQTGKAAAKADRAEAIRNSMVALQQTMAAVKQFTGAVAQGNAALEQKQHALKQKVSALNNSVAGLHNKI